MPRRPSRLPLLAIAVSAAALVPACGSLCPRDLGKLHVPLCPTRWGEIGMQEPSAAAAKPKSAPTAQFTGESFVFGEVAPGVTIAGQPSDGDWKHLHRMGFRTVVNLRTDAEGAERERLLVNSSAMQYFHVPVDGTGVAPRHADAVAKIVEDAYNGRVLVHCSSGNRAAAVWAIYLARHRGVARDQALAAGESAGMTKPKLREATAAAIGAQ